MRLSCQLSHPSNSRTHNADLSAYVNSYRPFLCIEQQSNSNMLEKKKNVKRPKTMNCHSESLFLFLLLFLRAINCVSEAEKQSRMAALLERLHAKHNASRPWQETSKIVRQAMVRQLYFIFFK